MGLITPKDSGSIEDHGETDEKKIFLINDYNPANPHMREQIKQNWDLLLEDGDTIPLHLQDIIILWQQKGQKPQRLPNESQNILPLEP